MKQWFKIIFFVVLCVGFVQNVHAQRYTKTRILFVLDGSYSMFGNLKNHTKIDVAKELLTKMVDSLRGEKNVELALRAYGHQTPKYKQDCKDTKLEVPFREGNENAIIEALNNITPKGTTPIAYSLAEAGGDFPESDRAKNVIILLTDGIEECEGDPCAVSNSLQKNNVTLKPFIIGLGIARQFKAQFDCVGRYYNATNKKEFREVLSAVVSQAINTTTTQVNLLDIYNKPTETNVNMTFYDAKQDLIRYNLYHTMDKNGNPDTLSLDPITKYNIQVHTTPPVWKKGVVLNPGEHNVIPIKTPQGKLRLKMQGGHQYGSVKTIVKSNDSCTIINEQSMNSTHRYLVGKYDLEILTQPKIKINNVKIKQDKVTPVEVPQPGNLYVSKSENTLGSIYYMKNNKMKWVCNISPSLRRELLVLQPGKYRIISRPVNSNHAYETKVKEFEITSGGSTSIKIN